MIDVEPKTDRAGVVSRVTCSAGSLVAGAAYELMILSIRTVFRLRSRRSTSSAVDSMVRHEGGDQPSTSEPSSNLGCGTTCGRACRGDLSTKHRTHGEEPRIGLRREGQAGHREEKLARARCDEWLFTETASRSFAVRSGSRRFCTTCEVCRRVVAPLVLAARQAMGSVCDTRSEPARQVMGARRRDCRVAPRSV